MECIHKYISRPLKIYFMSAFFFGGVMNITESIKNLSKFEKGLWVFSLITVGLSFILAGNFNFLTLIASLTGVSGLIFVSKGDVLGQMLIIVFGILYAIISYNLRYYGEMITYLGMTLPIAILSVVSWMKNPYAEREVEVRHLSFKAFLSLFIVAILVTWVFYYILKYFGTASLVISTISITTSFLASSLMMLRSPYYALFYGLNDIVLVILWVIASINDISFLPMVICFLIFLLNDTYGFINWNKMLIRQNANN